MAVATVQASSEDPGANITTASGNTAPTAKLAAEASAACKGLALSASEIPSSSRACAPSASWASRCVPCDGVRGA